jgi:ribosome-associated heat shock protein Hsp15
LSDRLRLDKWLWHARFFKTRGLAQDIIQSGRMRVNGDKIHKSSREIGKGDVLTFPQADRVRVIRVIGIPLRRGSAPEAQIHYEDLDPIPSRMPEDPGRLGPDPFTNA